jgi:hypothetical protein
MSYPICYLVDLNGDDFNALMASDYQAPPEYLAERRASTTFDMWKGMLVGNDDSFLVDLSGCWTLCVLGYSYSGLLADDDSTGIKTTVAEWENALRKAVPFQAIYRVDDFLLEPWNARSDYLFTRDPEAVRQYIAWLQTQDPVYWAMLPVSE